MTEFLLKYIKINDMNFLYKKIRKLLLMLKLKTLEKAREKSFANETSKTVISSTETLTLNSKILKTIEAVRKDVSGITETADNDPQKLIDYIEAHGTKVYRIKNANGILQKMNEHTGLITELCGLKAVCLNLMTGHGIGFKTKPMFILSTEQTDYYLLLREFYLWYSLNMKLPGFDFKTQEKFKKYLTRSKRVSFKGLHYGEMLKIREAIERDKEANEFVMEIIKKKDGSSNAFAKMISGGADI